jgi:hypothetical protein
MCGAIPVVIPHENKPKDEFYSDHFYKYGVAYGFEDIERAITTREKIYDYYCQLEDENIPNTIKFRDRCYNYFDKM